VWRGSRRSNLAPNVRLYRWHPKAWAPCCLHRQYRPPGRGASVQTRMHRIDSRARDSSTNARARARATPPGVSTRGTTCAGQPLLDQEVARQRRGRGLRLPAALGAPTRAVLTVDVRRQQWRRWCAEALLKARLST